MRRILNKLNTQNPPAIKFSNSCRATGKQEPNEVDQEVLEDTQLKLMHQVHNKQCESVEIKVSKCGVECIL